MYRFPNYVPAAEHLKNIFLLYKDKNPDAAVRIHNDIVDAVEPLKQFPEMAQKEMALLYLRKEYRSLVVRRTFKVIYYIKKETVYISAVLDCRQNPWKIKQSVQGK